MNRENNGVVDNTVPTVDTAELPANLSVSETESLPPDKNADAKFGIDPFGIAIAALSLAATVVALIVLLAGVTCVFHSSLNIVSAIEFVVGIFWIRSGKVYATLAKFAIGALYIFFLVRIVKNTVMSIRYACLLPKKVENKSAYVSSLFSISTDNITDVLVLAVVSYVVSGGAIGGGIYATAIAGGIVFLSASVLYSVRELIKSNRDAQEVLTFVWGIIRPVMFIVLFALGAKFMIKPSVYDISFGLQVLTNGYVGDSAMAIFDNFYTYLIEDAIFTAIAVIFCIAFKAIFTAPVSANDGYDLVGKRFRSNCAKMLALVCISAAMFALTMLIDSNGKFDISGFGDFINATRTGMLPAAILLVAGLIMSRSSQIKRRRNGGEKSKA